MQKHLTGSLGLTVRVLFSGGAEFTPEHEKVDRVWAQLSNVRAPHVVLLPVAVTDHLLSVERTAKRHLSRFGVQLEIVRAHGSGESSADSASLRPLNDALEGAHTLYLPDGSPDAALIALRTGRTAALIYRALTSGITLVACGASAMALCEFMWDGGGWESGLGLIQGVAVLPHHERIAARYGNSAPDRLRQGLADTTTVVGIDDVTGLLLKWPSGNPNGDPAEIEAQVIGAGAVRLYRPDGVQTYTDGQMFHLSPTQLRKGQRPLVKTGSLVSTPTTHEA